MPFLPISTVRFFSVQDEASFINWLNAIEGVAGLSGSGMELRIQVRSKRLADRSLRELIAIHSRYGLPMAPLAVFETEKNQEWFRDPSAHWARQVFA